MSGLLRSAKKLFKKVVHVVKKYWKVAAVAALAYFTFGVAMGAMGSATAATGATAAGTTAASTGAGVFSTVGAASSAAGIETVTVTASAAAGGVSAAGAAAAVGAAAAAAPAAAGGGGSAPSGPAPAPPAAAKPGLLAKAKGAISGLSFTDKLLLAKTGVDVITGLTAPTPEQEAAAAKKWQGSFYGQTADEAARGGSQFVAPATQGAIAKSVERGTQSATRDLMGGAADPGQTPAPAGAAMPPTQLQSTQFAAAPNAAQTPQRVTNQGGNRDLFATRAPGVRYLA